MVAQQKMKDNLSDSSSDNKPSAVASAKSRLSMLKRSSTKQKGKFLRGFEKGVVSNMGIKRSKFFQPESKVSGLCLSKSIRGYSRLTSKL